MDDAATKSIIVLVENLEKIEELRNPKKHKKLSFKKNDKIISESGVLKWDADGLGKSGTV